MNGLRPHIIVDMPYIVDTYEVRCHILGYLEENRKKGRFHRFYDGLWEGCSVRDIFLMLGFDTDAFYMSHCRFDEASSFLCRRLVCYDEDLPLLLRLLCDVVDRYADKEAAKILKENSAGSNRMSNMHSEQLCDEAYEMNCTVIDFKTGIGDFKPIETTPIDEQEVRNKKKAYLQALEETLKEKDAQVCRIDGLVALNASICRFPLACQKEPETDRWSPYHYGHHLTYRCLSNKQHVVSALQEALEDPDYMIALLEGTLNVPDDLDEVLEADTWCAAHMATYMASIIYCLRVSGVSYRQFLLDAVRYNLWEWFCARGKYMVSEGGDEHLGLRWAKMLGYQCNHSAALVNLRLRANDMPL